MKLYETFLRNRGLDVEYIDFKYMNTLSKKIANIQNIIYYDTVDHLLESKLSELLIGKNVVKLENQGFICSNDDLSEYLKSRSKVKRKFFHNDFYRWQRKRLNILIDEDGGYLGGKLSFDKNNRQKYPSGKIKYPSYHKTSNNTIIDESKKYVKTTFPNYLGNLDEFNHISFDFDDAKEKLNDFIKYRLLHFGDLEDIMDSNNPFIYHSLLSSSLNIGLITPMFVIDSAISYYKQNTNTVDINDIEGFIRQVLGWREYYRFVYNYQYDELTSSNYLNHKNKLAPSWYSGNTGLEPLDQNIRVAFKYGYLHHIIRLMVVGQLMLLCEIEPNEMYKWFMEFAIDSYDWVMVPNVYGMVGYNDGGGTTTKPYISSSNYVLKMSNYKKDGIWENVWRALYYNFIFKHIDILSDNPRTSRMVWQMNRLSDTELSDLIDEAETFINEL